MIAITKEITMDKHEPRPVLIDGEALKGGHVNVCIGYFGKKRLAYTVLALFLCAFTINLIEDGTITYEQGTRKPVAVSILRTFPLKTYSKLSGMVAKMHLPYPINVPILSVVRLVLGIDLSEAEEAKISSYFSVNELFSRGLRGDARPISGTDVISPVDGLVLYAGAASDSTGKIKGIEYKLQDFLGLGAGKGGAESGLLANPEHNRLYQAVVYLAPRDYHRFHSPTDFVVEEIKHIPGELISVGKWHMKLIGGLLAHNERVVFSGTGPFGYFSLVAVGSTGVGSIETPLANIRTNRFMGYIRHVYALEEYVQRGAELGKFNMGSTVVLLFEGPKNTRFYKQAGESIRVGRPLASFHGGAEEVSAQ